ncbi:MAG: hypothetical protein PHU32_05835 [Candidatus ainarchaeum sp.]|nr:hypothetical protein [Candidatus ainarchaeum sp.]
MKFSVAILLIILFTNCNNSKPTLDENYETISYLEIKIDSLGNLPKTPYIIDLKRNQKRLVVIGTLHSRDTNNQMFPQIEKIYKELKPEVAINEGGQISKIYTDKKTAITNNGELGFLKFLCDKQNIKMLNGDMPDEKEFNELVKFSSREKALLFFASERFVLPYTYFGTKGNIESLYRSDFIEGYMAECGIKLKPEEKHFSYYKSLYEKYFNIPFSIDRINSDDFSPIRKTNDFCNVARKSKELRDKYLLKKIEEQLKHHNKVLVVFGGWHVLAIEPALKQIINRVESSASR